MKNLKILDCTLRDGGYYTNWDFDKGIVDTYLDSFNQLPVDYLEIGYRSNPMKEYLGEYFYLPIHVIRRIRSKSDKKLVIILNEKDVRVKDVRSLLEPCIGLIDMVRMAVNPVNFKRSVELAKEVKSMGFEVSFNIMYMSTWKEHTDFLDSLSMANETADFFYMVDSFGGVYPDFVKELYEIVSSRIDVPIGFHGHNNLELALVNTLTAIDCGVEIVDATVTGMGRGAGNLKMELLLTVLNANNSVSFDFNALSKVVDDFTRLQQQYNWGTSLPYMVSGAHSLPQKDVMDWVGKRYYSFNSIIRALQNQYKGVDDNQELKKYVPSHTSNKVLIAGGGPSVKSNSEAIKLFLKSNPDITVIHASSKNALEFIDLKNKQIFCLVGNEGYRMENVFAGNVPGDAICILPPFPRKMGTYIPNKLENKAFELSSAKFSDKLSDSHTALALEVSMVLNADEVYVVGYDGYAAGGLSIREKELFQENEYLFEMAEKNHLKCTSITATAYQNLHSESIFSFI